jgi:diguanylate cyclase (GGDEF)-like protein
MNVRLNVPGEPLSTEARLADPASEAALLDRLERVTRFARRLFQVPIVWVSLLDAGELRVRACQGLPGQNLGRDLGLDQRVGADSAPVAIGDASADARLASHPLVRGRTRIRGYAACPVRSPELRVAGVLGIADRDPRAFGTSDLVLLHDLAALAETDLLVSSLGETRLKLLAAAEALEKNTLTDPLTQLWSRGAMLDLLERELHRSQRQREPVSLILAAVDDLDAVRRMDGAATADLVVVEAANRLRGVFRRSDVASRFAEDAFLVLLGRCPPQPARELVDRVREQFRLRPVRAGNTELPVTLSYGVASSAEDGGGSPEALVQLATLALAEARDNGIDQVVARRSERACP